MIQAAAAAPAEARRRNRRWSTRLSLFRYATRSAVEFLQEMLVLRRSRRIGERRMQYLVAHAHFGELDADRLGVEHRRPGRLLEIDWIDDVRNDLAAKRDDAFGALVADQ